MSLKTPTYGQDSTEEAILQGQAEGSTMPYRRRISESRVRENRMHGLMREGRGNPVLYSTPDYFHKSELSLNYLIIPEFSFVNVPARQCEFTLTMFFPIL